MITYAQMLQFLEWSYIRSYQCPWPLAFVCVVAFRPRQQFFSHAGTISCLPGLNHIKHSVLPASQEPVTLRPQI